MPATATPATVTPTPRPGPRFGPGRGPSSARGPVARTAAPPRRGTRPANGQKSAPADHEILFQKFFKSIGPRTYAAQVKRANNGNHYLVLMEGKRDEASDEVRKTRLFIYSEDFVEFFRLIKSAAEFVKANPLPDDVRRKREKFWEKQNGATGPRPSASPSSPITATVAAPSTSPASPASTRPFTSSSRAATDKAGAIPAAQPAR